MINIRNGGNIATILQQFRDQKESICYSSTYIRRNGNHNVYICQL